MYRVDFTSRADREFLKLPKNVQQLLDEKLLELANNPRPDGVKKLKNLDSYRVRVGDYRIIYKIQDNVLLIIVVRVGHRRDVYK